MEFSTAGYKTFLMCCNVALMFIGASILVLGIKMEQLLSVLLLINVPLIGQAVKAVIATGVFIAITGITGIAGACNEILSLIILHLVALGVIVIMEFALGVTLLVVRRTIENYIGSMECNTNCATTLDTLVIDYALPSAGLMLTVIIVEALMIYSALKLLSHIRDCPKILEPSGDDIIAHDVQMQSVASPSRNFGYSSYPDRTFVVSPHTRYPPLDASPHRSFVASPHRSFVASPQAWYTPERDYMQYQVQPAFIQQLPSLQQTVGGGETSTVKPPEYTALPPHLQLLPPSYVEAVPEPSSRTSNFQPKRDRSGSCNSV